MASMDDVLELLIGFSKQLGSFDESIQQSLKELHSCHAEVDPLWSDSFRRKYDEMWNPLEDQLEQYLRSEAPNYEDFLERKIRHLEEYLHGE